MDVLLTELEDFAILDHELNVLQHRSAGARRPPPVAVQRATAMVKGSP
jgi:hypothetical protein